jgi:uncharacterized protein YlxW (UPF0749 family)
MFKKADKIILATVGFFLGIFFVTQFYSTQAIKKVTQPENNEVIVLEVAKLSKTNADLRTEVKTLTVNLDSYNNSNQTAQDTLLQYQNDIVRYDNINSAKSISGQGVIISIDDMLLIPQIVDLVNAIKNIGYESIQVNNVRLSINTNLGQFSGLPKYEIIVLGNSKLIKSALERKGGIIEQITINKNKYSIEEKTNLEIREGKPLQLKYAKVVD